MRGLSGPLHHFFPSPVCYCPPNLYTDADLWFWSPRDTMPLQFSFIRLISKIIIYAAESAAYVAWWGKITFSIRISLTSWNIVVCLKARINLDSSLGVHMSGALTLAQWLRTRVAFAEDLGSTLCTHMVAHNHLIQRIHYPLLNSLAPDTYT